MLTKLFRKKLDNTGMQGEDEAICFLKKNGYKILERNWYNKKGKRLGEIDIIAEDKETKEIVFVEVKTRKIDSDVSYVLPDEQITPMKLQKLQRIADVYIKKNELWDRQWRFDAVSIIFVSCKKNPRINHIKNIFL